MNTSDDEVRIQVLKLHNYRCVGVDKPCFKYTKIVHEILPRSRGKVAYDIENRVPLCAECHEIVHARGVSEEMITTLRERRKIALRGEYDASVF